eukprot:gene644-biopygen530
MQDWWKGHAIDGHDHDSQNPENGAQHAHHVLSEELKGKSITELEGDLLEVEGLESAQKGHRLQQRVAAISANWVKLVAVPEEAAQKIESGAVKIPGLNDYAVQRVALMKEVDKLAETEVVVLDSGSVIDPEFDTEALVRAVDNVFLR